MQRNQKQSNSLLYDIAYTLTSKCEPQIWLNITLIVLQFALFLLKIYQMINPSLEQLQPLPYLSVFAGLSIVLAAFVLFTLLSYYFQCLSTVWFYFLLLVQALEMLYVQLTVRCFAGIGWCQGDSRTALLVGLMAAVFCLVIALRLQCYSPFYDSLNAFAMKSGKSVVYSFLYAWLLSLSNNQLMRGSGTGSKQVVFLLTVSYYWFIAEPPTFAPALSRTYVLCANTLLWTSAASWLVPLLQQLLNSPALSFWYYWGYSAPIVLLLSFLHSARLSASFHWQALFFQTQSRGEDLTSLFLQVNELTKEVALIKRSDLATNSPEFRKLWKVIAAHNDKCSDPECPLASLAALKIVRQDELLEEKRFNRTVQKALEFGLYCLTTQRETYPNLIALSLEIANFELQVFRLRTKGLQLLSKEWHRAESDEKWAIYCLKKRIESFEGSGEASSGERQEAIASFKHEIEKSVGMLAEFWYFLSDPKCNLKKLYDLANVLFPQKRRVDEAWKSVRALKNVDCHTLYAKYLIRMFNDKQQGVRVLEQAKRLQSQLHENEQVSAGQVLSQEHGVIFLQFDGKNSGVMYQVNSACERMFGYSRGELQGRKVNDIMPKFFAIHHDRILQHYQQTNRPRMMNKERAIWGRAKDGYCFPFLICIKPVRNYFSQTNEVYASLKRDLWTKEKAFFFADNDFNITDISASMLSVAPALAGRLHLKKKIPLAEVLPDPALLLPRLLLQETYDLTVTRTFRLSSRDTFSETVVFTVQAEEMLTAVAGKIGYCFKLSRSSLSSNYDPNSSNPSSLSREKQSSSGLGRDFKFMAALRCSEAAKKVTFQGGVVRDARGVKSEVIWRMHVELQQQRRVAQEGEVSRLATDWAGAIRTKRLQGNQVREIHELSEESEAEGAGGRQHSEEDGEPSERIKPFELSAILQRQQVNQPILLLKVLALATLLASALLCILQYLSLRSFNHSILEQLLSYQQLSSLQAQVMYLNNFANRLQSTTAQAVNLTAFSEQVFDLDSLTASIPYSVSAQLTYSDATTQSMLLGFAVNKLVSEADLLANANADSSSLFFVQFNSVNGLALGCEQGLGVAWAAVSSYFAAGAIFLALCGSLVGGSLLVQNLVLRKVLKKKADILNIFFEIPRSSCSFLQKECERFIQKLSNNEEEDQPELEEDEPQNARKNKTQKKRTIMGQEQTASEFLVISALMVTYFLLYPILIAATHHRNTPATAFSLHSLRDIVSIERELAKAISFMNTHVVRQSFPLASNQNAMAVVESQFDRVISLLGNVSSSFFYLGDILDQQYLLQYNQLFYTNLCKTSTSCDYACGQDQGLNVLLLNYINYLVSKYNGLKAAGNYNLTLLYSDRVQAVQESYRLLLKKYWRQLQSVLTDGLQRFLASEDAVLFGMMVGVSVLNLSVLLYIWLKFYNELEKKIKATEYILTFIPLDEINKNAKIVQYIKDKIVKMK